MLELSADYCNGLETDSKSQKRVLGSYDDLIPILHEQTVEEVVFALPSEDLKAAREILNH